jgi:hypothetical protein
LKEGVGQLLLSMILVLTTLCAFTLYARTKSACCVERVQKESSIISLLVPIPGQDMLEDYVPVGMHFFRLLLALKPN